MSASETSSDIEELARRIHARATVVDSLTGSLSAPARALQAGVSTVHVTIAIRTEGFLPVLHNIFNQYCFLDYYPDQALLVTSTADIERAKAEGKVGVMLGFQGARWMEDQPERITILHRLGVRVGTATYMERNLLGDGCLEPENRGLTNLGTQWVHEMNRLGMLIDLSHVGYRTCEGILACSRDPVAITHSNSRTICDVPRNVPDSLIKAVIERGGFIGVSPYTAVVGRPEKGRPTLEDFLRHLDHVVGLVGVEHVGIGSDLFDAGGPVSYTTGGNRLYPDTLSFAYPDRHVSGFESILRWPDLTRALVAHGYSEPDILGILGGNFLRLLRRVWRN